jgi:hypothetical protein
MRTAWFLPNHGNDSLPAFLGLLTSVIESRTRTRPKFCLRKAGLCYRVPNKDSLQALPPHRFTFNKEHASDSLQALSSTLFSLVIASRKTTRSKVCLWTAGPFSRVTKRTRIKPCRWTALLCYRVTETALSKLSSARLVLFSKFTKGTRSKL